MNFTFEDKGGQRALVRLEGRLDASSALELKDSLKRAAENGTIYQVIDMAAVNFIDSSGLSVLVAVYKTVRERGGSIVLVQVGPQVRVALELTRLDQVFPTYADAKTGLEKVGQ